jgi:hypothetical protein
MKNYILIISVLTIVIVFIVLYLSDYIKNIYFNNSILDFKDAYSIISNYHNYYENYENNNTTNQERSLNTETEKYRKRVDNTYDTINDPISDEYLPYTTKNYKEDPSSISNNNINEYTIINIYKNILDRQPTDYELNKNLQDFYDNEMDENILKLRIYNSSEYKIITNMQSNDIKPELITNISKGQLKDKIKEFYNNQYNTELVNTKLLDILIKCYVHLQFNDYLFKAMLMHDNYTLFENRLRDEYILSDEKILDIFNKSFILYELRLIANELKRQDIIKRKALLIPVSLHKNEHSELNSSNININTGKHISDIVKNSDNVFNINIMLNDKNNDMSSPYLRDEYEEDPQNIPDNYEEDQIDYQDNLTNQQNVSSTSNIRFANNTNNTNTNNTNNTNTNNTNSTNSTNNTNNTNNTNSYSSNIAFTNTSNIGLNNILQNAINNGVNNQYNSQTFMQQLQLSQLPAQSQLSQQQQLQQLQQQRLQQQQLHPQLQQLQQQQQLLQPQQPQQPQQQPQRQQQQSQRPPQRQQQQRRQQSPNRIYNPIDYKQNYRGDMRYRPSVCSYGTKQIVQPIFVNSSTLFQGTDLKEATENTQVGSIMPKFKYYEYEDIK